MDRQELIDNLGTIARSGTKSFLSRLTEAKDGANLIGQFGVGFYAAFMVAERIVVTSRRAGTDQVWTWSSSGGSGFEIAPASEDDAKRVTRGTEIVLHLKKDAAEISRDLRDRAHRPRLFRQHPVSDCAGAGGGRAAPDQFGERAVAAAEIGTDAGGLQARLSIDRRRLRRARDDAALPRRGPAVLCGVAVRAVDKAVRPVRPGAQGQGKALCPPRLHCRRCRSVAGLFALHPRRDRQRGPAAEYLPRDAAEQSAARADPKSRHQPRDLRARKPRRQGAGGVRKNLGRVRSRDQGRPLGGFRAAREIAGAVALHHDVRREPFAQAICREYQAEPDRDLLPHRRQHRAAEVEPEAGIRPVPAASRCCC